MQTKNERREFSGGSPSQEALRHLVDRWRADPCYGEGDYYAGMEHGYRACADALDALLVSAASSQPPPWLPIESAPKTSRHILVWTPGNRCQSLVVWSVEPPRWEHAFSSHDALLDEPTHWKPLDAPPSAAASSQPPQDRSAWLTQHVDLGHGIVKREEYDECSCGATFWRVAAPSSQEAQTPACGCDSYFGILCDQHAAEKGSS